MPIPMPIPIPICPYRKFRMQKKKLALEMKNLNDFPYSLMHIRPSDEISMFKVNNNNIRTGY